MRAFFPVLAVLSAADTNAASAVVKSPGVDGRWYSGPADWSKNGPVAICEKPALDQNYGACQTDWTPFNNNCYKLLSGKRTGHFESTMACNELGAYLATIGSAEENAFVEKICGNNMCWLGLSEPLNSETWQWIDGSQLTYVNWADSKVNWFDVDNTAAFMNFHRSLVPPVEGKLYGAPRSYSAPYPVCKLVSSVCPAGWTAQSTACFKLIRKPVSFDTALYLCSQESPGAYLSNIKDDAEKDHIKKICGQNMCWIGCYLHKEKWTWIKTKGDVPSKYFENEASRKDGQDSCMINFVPENRVAS